MKEGPAIERIFIYPIKALEHIALEEAIVLPSGALQHDREFALFDEQGKWINGKRDARVHQIRTEYDLREFGVTIRTRDSSPARFHLLRDRQKLEQWFGDFFGFRVHVRRNEENGFPDDLESPGPTIISSATLREVGTWFGILDHDETSRRFRANLEIKTTVPFWEDRLFGNAGAVVPFRIGDVSVHGVNPCQRCVVPSRDSQTGVAIDNFQKLFANKRAETLPSWADSTRFNHYYRLSINTRIPPSEAGKVMRIGDAVEVDRCS